MGHGVTQAERKANGAGFDVLAGLSFLADVGEYITIEVGFFDALPEEDEDREKTSRRQFTVTLGGPQWEGQSTNADDETPCGQPRFRATHVQTAVLEAVRFVRTRSQERAEKARSILGEPEPRQ